MFPGCYKPQQKRYAPPQKYGRLLNALSFQLPPHIAASVAEDQLPTMSIYPVKKSSLTHDLQARILADMKRAPRDFDLPTSPMPGLVYVPRKARDPHEIARRRALLPGELVLEQQFKGLRVGRVALAGITERKSVDFALPLVSLAALNSVWHVHAEPERNLEAGIRRRRLKYPTMTDWQDSAHLLEGVKYGLAQGEKLAARLVLLHGTDTAELARVKRDFATCVGNAALAGAVVTGLGENPIPGSPLRAQQVAREYGLRLLESRAAVAEQIGSAPTLAQLADRDSDLSVYWRRNAPDQAHAALVDAQLEVPSL